MWITNVTAELTGNGTVSVIFSIAGGTNGLAYDVFANAAIGPTNGASYQWAWMGQGNSCYTYQITNLPGLSAFLLLGTPLDRDGDGLTDAYESLVSHTDPNCADQNGNGIPDGWEWHYFGTLALSADTDYDSNGMTILQEYQQGMDPNRITFSVAATNQFVNQTSTVVSLSVVGGIPSSQAVLVDSASPASAVWTPYTGQDVLIPLGTAEGWHTVSIGLRGLPLDAQQTWQHKRFKVDLTPPQLVVISPSNTVSQTMIQLLGHCPKNLSGISFTLSNALGVMPGRQICVSDRFLDTNTWEFTTNTFQAFDVDLALGPNTFTLTATDLAGNLGTTSYNITLQSNTVPPQVALIWPLDGMALSGNSFTIQGVMDNPSATISATLFDTNGDTSSFAGVVERNGKFWFENLPLNGGTNWLTLVAVDAWGNTTTTNITVSLSDIALTVDAVDPDQLFLPSIPLSGTVSDPDCSITVNGLPAENNGDGTWSADDVPVDSGGTATFRVLATKPGSGGPAEAANSTIKPPRLYIESYSNSSTGITAVADDYWNGYWCDETDSGLSGMGWQDQKGGSSIWQWQQAVSAADPSQPATNTCTAAHTWPATLWPKLVRGTFTDAPSGCGNGGPVLPVLPCEHADLTNSQDWGFIGWDALMAIMARTATHPPRAALRQR